MSGGDTKNTGVKSLKASVYLYCKTIITNGNRHPCMRRLGTQQNPSNMETSKYLSEKSQLTDNTIKLLAAQAAIED